MDLGPRSKGSFLWSPRVSNAKNPDGAGWVYIEASHCDVSRPFAQGCIAPKFRTSQHIDMRPLALNPLFGSVRSLTGVGPKLEKLYARLLDRDAPRVVDLLFHMPSGVIDRRARPKLCDVQTGQVVTVSVVVDKHRPSPPHRSRAPYRIYAHDDTGDITLTFFNARRDYLEKLLPVGETRYVSGTAEFYDGMRSFNV